MKNLTLILFLVLTQLYVGQVFALSSFEVLREKAQTDQKSLIESIEEVGAELSEITSRRSFDEYFNLIEIFNDSAEKFNLDIIYPDAVEILAAKMVAHGNRWLSIENDSLEVILSYQVWADVQAAQRFLFQMQNQIDKIKDEETFKKAVTVLSELADLTKEMFPEDLYISQGYDENVSLISVKVIRGLDILNQETVLFWLNGIRTQDSILNLLSYANNEILSDSLTPFELKAWHEYLLYLGDNNLKRVENLREASVSFYGDTLVESTFQLLEAEINIENDTIVKIISLLNVSRIKFLSERWVNPNFKISSSYFPDYFEMTNNLYNSLVREGFSTESNLVGRYLTSRLSSNLITGLNQEGTYEFRDQANRKWTFTVLRESYDRIIAAISNDEGTVNFNYYSVQYNIEEKLYVASTYAPDDSPESLDTIKFKFNEDASKVEIEMPFAAVIKGSFFTATKSESYEDISAQAFADSNIIEGRYEGQITLPSGRVNKVTLSVVQFQTYVLAKLEAESGTYRIDLKTGTDGKDGYIYLTGGRRRGGSWFHMRLLHNHDNGDLDGFLVIGGRGKGQSSAHFTRVQD